MKKNILYLLSLIFIFYIPFADADNIIDINNKIPSDGIGDTYISGFSFYNKKTIYESKSGLAIFEGDIILGSVEEAENFKSIRNSGTSSGNLTLQSTIITGRRFRWINNLIPFQFSENVSDNTRNMVLDAIAHWRNNSEIEFVERNAGNAINFPDFVTIVSNEFACWSFVGRIGGNQLLNVVEACEFGATVHEFGHAVGLWHEQSREDRDNFVQINWSNIQPGRENNFKQHINDGDDIGVYDYNSIMHYGAFAFSSNGQPTITPLQPVNIGQRNGLSSLDIASILQNYPAVIPVAKLDKTSYSIFLGNGVLLDARLSFDPNGTPLTYAWSTGDGTISTSSNSILTYTYQNRGTYDISLTVTDADGFTNTDTAIANVYGYEVLIPVLSLLL